jgi:hypothetical protein
MALVALSGPSCASQRSTPAADPADPQATVPPLVYRSTLADHRPMTDAPAVPWPKANVTVGQIGGWRSYAREASEADSAMPSGKPHTAPATQRTPAEKPMAHGAHQHGHQP